MKKTGTELTYVERADKERRKAVAEGLKAIARDEKIVQKGLATIDRAIADTVNGMRRQGDALQSICGHNQVTFQFVKDMVCSGKAKLPWGDGTASKENLQTVFETARHRVAIAARIPGDIASWKDVAIEARRAVLCQIELLTVCGRGLLEDGVAPRPNDGLMFVFRNLGRLKHDYLKCIRLEPLEKRSRTQLEDFLEDTEWIEDQRKKAAGLLKGKC